MARDHGSLALTGWLGRLRLRLWSSQGEVSRRVQRLTHRLRVFTVELSQCWSSSNYFFVLVRTREVIQSKEIHLLGAPDVTAGQPCVSVNTEVLKKLQLSLFVYNLKKTKAAQLKIYEHDYETSLHSGSTVSRTDRASPEQTAALLFTGLCFKSPLPESDQYDLLLQ